MKKTTLLTLTIVACLSSLAFGQTEVPHTFEAGQPARAAEVNANFDQLETAINANGAAISTAESAISGNTIAISDNATEIAGNNSDIASNSAAISGNNAEIQNNASNIQSNAAAIAAIEADLLDPALAQTVQDLLDYVCLNASAPYPDFCPLNFKQIFATSQTYTGNLGGIAGADAQCTSLAAAAGLSGTYVALLSTDTSDARDRVTEAPYRRASDKELIAISKTDLFDGNLQNPVLKDENGNAIPPSAELNVWTGSNSDGTRDIGANCGNWTIGDTSTQGRLGRVDAIDAWISSTIDGCQNGLVHLYCIEQ